MVAIVVYGLKGACDFLDVIGFDEVAFFDVVEVGESDAAFCAGLDLSDVVFEAAERGDLAGVEDDDAVACEADHGVVFDDSVGDDAAGDVPEFGDFEDLFDVGVAGDGFASFGFEEACECGAHVVYGLEYDLVESEVDFVLVGEAPGACVGDDAVCDDDGVGGVGKEYVGFVDGADSGVYEADFDFGGGEAVEFVFECFE